MFYEPRGKDGKLTLGGNPKFRSTSVKRYKRYNGRNPKTGQPVQIEAKKLLFFKCGLELKERVDYKETKTKKEGKRL